MTRKGPESSSEGVVIAYGMLIILLCVAGSVSTHTSVVGFFFASLAFIILSSVGVFFLVCLFVVLVYTVRRPEDEKRPIWQILKEDYHPRIILEVYVLLYLYCIEYLEEYEWYHKAIARYQDYRAHALYRLRLGPKPPPRARPPTEPAPAQTDKDNHS